MSNLTPEEITELLTKQAEQIVHDMDYNVDNRRPIRKAIDDKVIPAIGLAAGAGVAVAKGIAGTQYTERLKQI